MNTNQFNTIKEALEDFKSGKPIIVADDEDRENEGDLICSAQFVTPELINFITKECRGLVCLAISNDIAEKLELPQMVSRNTESMQTAFSLSIDAHPKYGIKTGISAFDRAKTIEVAIAPDSLHTDLVRPGHMFPCVAKKGGVLKRCGHTEAVVDLAILSGHRPAGVMCEIMAENGELARRDELSAFAKKHGIKEETEQQKPLKFVVEKLSTNSARIKKQAIPKWRSVEKNVCTVLESLPDVKMVRDVSE